MEIRQLAISLHDGGNIVIQTQESEELVAFSGFKELLGIKSDFPLVDAADVELVTRQNLPQPRHTLKRTEFLESAYSADWSRVFVAGASGHDPHKNYYQCRLWQAALICGAMNQLFRGGNALLAHGAALETEQGAVLLFGESGMGKSTAATRWRASGGKCISDDMVLLDFSGESVFVRRMPTWSACRESRNLWNYPSEEELPLHGVLALGRSENGIDEIVPLSEAQFFAQIYRSMFYWNLSFIRTLPEERQQKLANIIRERAQEIAKNFPPRALLSALDGDLLQFLREKL